MYKRFFAMQSKFDKRVVRQLGVNQPTITQKVLAIIVEMGEFANDEGSVKYWKKRKTQNLQNALFEYIDMLKFTISIARDLELTYKQFENAKMVYYQTMDEQLMALGYCTMMVGKHPSL